MPLVGDGLRGGTAGQADRGTHLWGVSGLSPREVDRTSQLRFPTPRTNDARGLDPGIPTFNDIVSFWVLVGARGFEPPTT